jgi:hypothetical protein
MALHSTAVYGTVSLPKKVIFEPGQILKTDAVPRSRLTTETGLLHCGRGIERMRSIGLPEQLFLLGVGAFLIPLIPFWKIFSKAGYPGAMGLIMLVPSLSLIMLFYLGFAEWPVLRELERLRRQG